MLRKTASLLALCAVVAITSSCGEYGAAVDYGADKHVRQISNNAVPKTERFVRNVENIDFSSVMFERWDIDEPSRRVSARDKKPYTVMVYMNGSDLESEEGAATDDLIEMLDAGVSSESVNLVIFTGGANRWQNDVVPENECVLWEIKDGKLHKIAGIGLVNMGNAGTLSSFIDFGIANFPADKYGLIMWDHGGGSIAGYGDDENFNKGNLTLLDLNYAFESSMLSSFRLEFLGFDSCLMATSEMAVIASDYANYLIASVDLEPGDGWDYTFLSAFNDAPNADGYEVGKVIVDSFMNYYGKYSDEILTLSVTDLSEMGVLQAAVDNLMARCLSDLSYDSRAFRTLARRRGNTKTFGDGSPRNNDCDMVDIKSLASSLSDLFPEEAREVLERLDEAVVYSRDNSDSAIGGLSLYYVYGGKRYGRESLDLYEELQTNGVHTSYLDSFFSMLTNEGGVLSRSRSVSLQNARETEVAETLTAKWEPYHDDRWLLTGLKDGGADERDGLWATVAGQSVCMYEINQTEAGVMCAIPAELNGKRCDIIAVIGANHEAGEILGARNDDGLIIQKGLDKIKQGDILAFYYEAHDFESAASESGVQWVKGESVTVENAPVITSQTANEQTRFGVLEIDITGERHFSKPL